MAEIWYDGTDQNCDGKSDYDRDGDGFDSDGYGGKDCNDVDKAIFPGATEIWYDGTDQDCSGGSDYDQDGDGYDSKAKKTGGTDCDDLKKAVHPGATEVWYDGVDQDCSGGSDYDKDGDGYDSKTHKTGGTDCDDAKKTVNPGAKEVWYDGVDQDCSGGSDYDQDGDGYDSETHKTGGTDCDDTEKVVHPGGTEVRDALDNSCNSYCDEGLLSAGDIVIVEIMRNPDKVVDGKGEWFELYNTSTTDIALCEGWYVEDAGTDYFDVLDDSLVIPAGGYLVFGNNSDTKSNGGVVQDYSYGASQMYLGNSADEIYVVYDDPTLKTPLDMDTVNYGTTGWPTAVGKSMSYDLGKKKWCNGTTTYGLGDVGTPGKANDACP